MLKDVQADYMNIAPSVPYIGGTQSMFTEGSERCDFVIKQSEKPSFTPCVMDGLSSFQADRDIIRLGIDQIRRCVV